LYSHNFVQKNTFTISKVMWTLNKPVRKAPLGVIVKSLVNH